MKYLRHFCVIALLKLSVVVKAYNIPNVNLELTDNGFRVSIPDEPGLKYVAFNINRNRPFKSFEPGEFSMQVRDRSTDCNCWVYEGNRKLQSTDTIYIWINVQHNQLVYRSVAPPISVFELQNSINPSATVHPTTAQPSASTSSHESDKCLPSITKVKNRSVCSGELIFEDNFDNVLNTRIWKPEVYMAPDTGDAEFVLYDDSQLRVNDGQLVITPLAWNEYNSNINIKTGTLNIRDRCTGAANQNTQCYRQANRSFNILPPIVAGRISTRDSFSFKYGRVEIRAKLPQGDWLFPLLLLEPLKYHFGENDYASGQLRLAFARGNHDLWTPGNVDIGGKVLYGGAVTNTNPNLRDSGYVKRASTQHYGNDFHLYTTIWTDEKITFKVDNQVYGELNGDFSSQDAMIKQAWTKSGKMAPFDQEFYITLGVSGGGHGDFLDGVICNGHEKPWINTSPKAMREFWKKRSNWKSTWNHDRSLQVQYVGVYAI